MGLQQLKDVTTILLALPALFVTWKLPAVFRWIKMRLAQAFASAIMSQLQPELDKMALQIGEVRHQVFPNSGSSMADKLNLTLASSGRVEETVNRLQATMRAHQDADLSQARFEADSEGRFLWASYALMRWCSRSLEQVAGYGWINCVAQSDRDRVRAEWEASIEEQREFLMTFHLRDIDGGEFPVEAFAKPTHGVWVGTINRGVAA